MPQTKAVIVVDLYGSMPDWDAILKVARGRGVAVIEDAAEAIGSEYAGRKAGSFGDASVFSFHGSKTLTTGEGGMLLTDDEELYRRALFLRDHGRKPGDRMFFNHEVAYKYKMSSMQAALGLAQLERIEELLAAKRQIFSWYKRELRGVNGISAQLRVTGHAQRVLDGHSDPRPEARSPEGAFDADHGRAQHRHSSILFPAQLNPSLPRHQAGAGRTRA
jgi:dTDP-4-amino-4,6-dideoxygalactose transaminase